MQGETRFRMVEKIDPERFRMFARLAQLNAERRMATYQHIAQLRLPREAQIAAVAESAAAAGDDNE